MGGRKCITMGMFKYSSMEHLLNSAVENTGELLAGGHDMGEVLFQAALFLEGNNEDGVIIRPDSLHPVYVLVERNVVVEEIRQPVENIVHGVKYIDLWEIEGIQSDIGAFEFYTMKDGRQYPAYIDGERNILTPALKKAGYELLGDWYTGEGDSFGPLSRCIDAAHNGESIVIVYG